MTETSPSLLVIDAQSVIRTLYEINRDASPADRMALVMERVPMTFRRILSEIPHTHAVAAFDHPAPSWRHAVWPGYKAGRSPVPTLYDGIPQIRRALACNVRLNSVQIEGAEADDLIASLVDRWRMRDRGVVVIVTMDKDMMALIDVDVHVYQPFARKWRDPSYVRRKLGIDPGQMPDFLALVGDRSDGVGGVPGIGNALAKQLLQAYPRGVKEILRAAAVGADESRPMKLVREAIPELELARSLTELKRDCYLGLTWSELRRMPDREEDRTPEHHSLIPGSN